MEIATAFVTIRPQTDSFAAEVAAAAQGVPDQEVTVAANTEEAQSEIDAIDPGTADVEVGADTEEAQAEIDGVDGGTAEITVGADTSEAESEISGLGDQVSSLVGAVGGSGGGGAVGALDAFGGAAVGAGAAGATAATGGLAALALGLGASVSAASEAEVVQARLNAILEATGAGSSITAGQIQSMATEIEHYSGQSDEAIQSSATLLLTFNGLSNKAAIQSGVFERAVKATADIAALMGGDASDSAIKLGRALDDPEKGLSALTRSGISFTQAQKDEIAALQDSGDVLGAQKKLLEVVESQVGGTARAYGDTLTGQVDKAKQSIDDAAEVIGTSMIPVLKDLAKFLGGAAQGFTDLNHDLGGFLAGSPALEILHKLTGGNAAANGQLGDSFTQAGGAAAAFAASQEDVNSAVAETIPTLAAAVEQVNAAGESFGVLDAASDPATVLDHLRLMLFGFQSFQNDLAQIAGDGVSGPGAFAPRLAGALQALGPEVAGGLAHALAQGDAATRAQLEVIVGDIGDAGGDVGDAFTGQASGAINAGAPAVGAAGGAAGHNAASSFGSGISSLPSSAGAATRAAGGQISANAPTGAAYSAGYSSGQRFGAGFGAALGSSLGAAVGRGIAAARAQANAATPGEAFGIDRRAIGGGGVVIHHQTILDGQVLASSVTEHQRVLDVAGGYEP